ncbi:MAG: hypothetical protein ACK4ST_09465, partial [Elioraea tepidiphila]
MTTQDDKRDDVRLAVGPVPVARLLAKVARLLAGRVQAATARLAVDWPQVVGPALAAVTAPAAVLPIAQALAVELGCEP